MFAQVERLVDNLHRIGLPAMEQRKPARQRSELLEIVSEFENFDAAWIDETIEAWWSWHDGITEPADSPWPGVSPDGLAIHSFRGVLEAFEGRLAMAADEGKDIEAITRSTMFEMPVIPLVDEADIICLRKGSPHPDAPWELWTYGTEHDWARWFSSEGSRVVSFEEYIETLTSRMEEGVMQLDPYLGVVERDYESGVWYFPWR